MQELLNSLVRLSAAVTVFSMQSVQTAVSSVDAKESMEKMRGVIDAMADAITSKIDESKRGTLDSINTLGHDMVGRTIDTLKVPAMSMNPRELMQSGVDMTKNTTNWIKDMVMPSAAAAAASEPKAAEEVLA